MWCYVDESWQTGVKEHVGVLAGVVGPATQFAELTKLMYRIRKKYYGIEHARDLARELKGKSLLSNNSLKHQEKGYSKNTTVAREVLEWVAASDMKVVGITVYGASAPPLLSQEAKDLARPFKELCIRVMTCVPEGKTCQMVFDQRVGAQQSIAIAVHNYIAGMVDNSRLSPFPLMGVSNTLAGLQLADIVAYILGRYSRGDDRFLWWYKKVSSLQSDGDDYKGQRVYGLRRLQWEGEEAFSVRTKRLQ